MKVNFQVTNWLTTTVAHSSPEDFEFLPVVGDQLTWHSDSGAVVIGRIIDRLWGIDGTVTFTSGCSMPQEKFLELCVRNGMRVAAG